MDFEGEEGPKLALWDREAGPCSIWGMVQAKAEGQQFVLPCQEQQTGFWDDCWERRLRANRKEPV